MNGYDMNFKNAEIVSQEYYTVKITARREKCPYENEDVFVDIDSLKWRENENKEIVLTLQEISDQLLKMGYLPVFYVVCDSATWGHIYYYGNYDDGQWTIYAETMGYA